MSKKTNGKKGNTKTTNGKKESKNMAAKKNGKEVEVKGLNLPEMRKFAKSFGIKVTGRGQDKVLGEVLTAIEGAYGAAEEEPATFETWKERNKAMIQFHIDNSEKAPATEPESPPEKAAPAEEPPEEVHAVVNKKGAALAKAKAKAAEAKGKVAGKKAEKEKKESKGSSCWGQRLSSMAGAMDELFAQGANGQAVVKAIAKQFDRDERLATNAVMRHIAWLNGNRKTEIGGTLSIDRESKGWPITVSKAK